jgi:outer membrane lipoprotein-sorting protein
MIKLLGALCGAFIMLAASASSAAPALPKGKTLSDADRADIQRAQDYLNGVRTLKAKFIQTDPNGKSVSGVVSMQRPGKMRLEYDPPIPMLVVVTGIWVIYEDTQLHEATYVPIDSTPASYLLKENLQFGKDVHVLSLDRGPGVIRMTVSDKRDLGSGALILTFSDKPLVLQKWTVVDSLGQTTEVALQDTKFGVNFPPATFQYVDKGPNKQERN